MNFCSFRRFFTRSWSFRSSYKLVTSNLSQSNRSKYSQGRHILVPISSYALAFFGSTQASPNDVEHFVSEAYISVNRGNLKEADRTLHKALEALEKDRIKTQMSNQVYAGKRAYIFSEMANVFLLDKKLSEAEKLLIQTISDCLSAGMARDNTVIAELSLKLALIYARLGKIEKATEGYKFCKTTQEARLKQMLSASPMLSAQGQIQLPKMMNKEDKNEIRNQRALVGMINNYYSKFLFEQHDLSEALQCAQQALQCARALYSMDHINCLTLMSDVAGIQMRFIEGAEPARDMLYDTISLVSRRIKKTTVPNQDIQPQSQSLSPELDAVAKQYSDDSSVTDLIIFQIDILTQWAAFEASQCLFKLSNRLVETAENLIGELTSNQSQIDSENRKQRVTDAKTRIEQVKDMRQRYLQEDENQAAKDAVVVSSSDSSSDGKQLNNSNTDPDKLDGEALNTAVKASLKWEEEQIIRKLDEKDFVFWRRVQTESL